MGEAKHSPGPWSRDFDCDEITDAANCVVADIHRRNLGAQIANARLIAAAPDMLEALENIENDGGTSMPKSAWEMIRKAIAKAKGGDA